MHKNVGFVGLGAMGYPMAANLARLRPEGEDACLVYDQNDAQSQRHACEFGTRAASSLEDLRNCSVVFLSLPTSREVAAVCDALALPPGAIVADCTSGDPLATRQVADRLAGRRVALVDCAVSGGPAGARSGQLASMVGGDEEAVAAVAPYLRRMAQKSVSRVGGVGAGHAVKAVNNTLNAGHLALASEGLLALAKFGIAPEKALEAINASSGRSLQTEVRLPREVLSRDFAYGFPLGLMLKDVNIAVESVCGDCDDDDEALFPRVRDLLRAATAQETPDADYTRVVRVLEARAGRELHAGGAGPDGADCYAAPPYVPTRGKFAEGDGVTGNAGSGSDGMTSSSQECEPKAA